MYSRAITFLLLSLFAFASIEAGASPGETKYFGYFNGAMDGLGDKDYIPELAAVSNLIFIQSANLEQKLTETESYGKKAIVSLAGIFMDGNFRLRPDSAKIFEEQVEPVIKRHLSTVVAFYGLDEPYHNSIAKGLSIEETFRAQESMGQYLKSRFPQIPIAVVLTTEELAADHPLFPSFDWFGFDCYEANLKCQGRSVSWYFEHLEQRLKAMTQQDGRARSMIAVPQAGYPARKGSFMGEYSVVAQMPFYYNLALKNPMIKAVMPFLWQSFRDPNDSWVGVRELNEERDTFARFYRDFSGEHGPYADDKPIQFPKMKDRQRDW